MKVALCQIQAYDHPLGYDRSALHEQWRRRLSWALEGAAAAHADLVVLPELATIPYLVELRPDIVRANALSQDDELLREAREAAASRSLAIVVPYPEKADGAFYNSVSVFSATGARLLHYRKLHVPSGERAPENHIFSPGTEDASVFELKGMRIGLALCYDRHFPEVFRTLALKGARAVIVPSAAAGSLRDVWTAEGVAHAVFNRMYYMAVNRVGAEADPDRPFFGRSFVASPWGDVIAAASVDHPDCVVVRISNKETAASRRAWPFLTEYRQAWQLSRR